MEYISVKEASKIWNISERRIRKLLLEGRIEGAKKIGNSWSIPKDIQKPIDNRYKKQNNTILDFLNTNKNYFEDFITRCTYHSNAIEGNTLTYAETYALLFNDSDFFIDKKTPREIYEAINHKNALEFILKSINNPLTIDFIKQIGIQINKNISEINDFRNVQVIILGSEHIPPKPSEVYQLMMYFVSNYNNDSSGNIFDKIARFHIEFEDIHPFLDGNGRTGRLLINYELIKNNLAPAIIDKDNRNKYYELLREKNEKELSKWLEELSNQELERLRLLGYEK